jgi:serine phosphatase RsbU (regulator of sigma subunit)/Tfp pilus assembly protein PilF
MIPFLPTFFAYFAKNNEDLKTRIYISKAALLLFFLLFLVQVADGQTDSLEKIAQNTGDDSLKADILSQLAREYTSSDPSRAEKYYLEAAAIAKKKGRKKQLAGIIHNFGTFYYVHSNYPMALDCFLQGLKIREEFKDSASMAKSYNNIALVHYEQNNLVQALVYNQRSIAIKLRLKDKKGLASSYGNVGNIYYKQGRQRSSDSIFDICLNFQLKALKLYQELCIEHPEKANYQAGLSGTYNNLGNIYFEKAFLSKAKDFYTIALSNHIQAIEIQQRMGDTVGISHSAINMASIYEKQKKYDLAIAEYEKALKIVYALGLKEEMKTIYEGLSNVYEHKKDFSRSLSYYKKFTEIKDTILNSTTTEQIAEMQVKFETDKKEKEIELLNKEQKIKNAELEQQKLQRRSLLGWSITAFITVGLVVALLLLVLNKNRLKSRINVMLEAQNKLISFKNKEITDSIRYAQRIQEAVFPPDTQFNRLLSESFILYKPKDIVSGDFYWVEEWGTSVLLAVADCTGHGVPGAFMSIVGNNLLNQAVNVHGLHKPFLILNDLNKNISKILHQTIEESKVKDGMDISLVNIDRKNMKLEFSGAYNDLWIIRDYKMTELKADKFPVGVFVGEELRSFSHHEFDLQKGDMLYLFTDGYADQFGGPNEKKFKYSRLRDLILANSGKPMNEQKKVLDETWLDWKGDLEQLDDICIIGVRI